MHSTILTIGIILGVCSLALLGLFLFCYVGARVILAAFEPEQGSNAHLRQWLNAHPGKDLAEYPTC